MASNYQQIASKLLEISHQSPIRDLFPTLVPGASEFVFRDPYAFCMATCLDRGTKADLIWTIPYWLNQILGHLKPRLIYQMSVDQLANVVNQLPMKPRYVDAAPKTIQSLTKLVVEKYIGHAERIWTNRRALDVRKDFLSIWGVGPGIANMAVLLIEKAYDIRFSDLDHTRMDIKPDVHTMRVLYRLGVSAATIEDEAVTAARYLNPSFPGEIDAGLWLLGRQYCSASSPNCRYCPVDKVCPKVM